MLGHAQTPDQKFPVFSNLQITVAVLSVITMVAAFYEATPVVAVRFAALIAFSTQIAMEMRSSNYVFLKSPVFLLGFAACVGFSLLPSFVLVIAQSAVIPRINIDVFLESYVSLDILKYFGDTAEYYVIAFSMAAFSVYCLVRYLAAAPSARAPSPIPVSRNAESALAIASVLLTAVFAVNLSADLLPPSASGFLGNAYAPLQSFLLLTLLHQYLTKNTGGLRLVALIAAAIAVSIAAHQAKAPLFLLVSMSFYFTLMRKLPFSSALKFAAAFLVIIFFVVQTAQVLRTDYSSVIRFGGIDIEMAVDVFTSKIVWRQVDTGNCLRNVIKAHGSDDFMQGDHLFWVRGLVPRAFWPEKESLSLGSKYALTYCKAVIENTHSASITLLGQPIIKAGAAGMVIHVGILLAALGALTWIAIRRPGLGTVSVMALLPWWIDFDQDFALYVANLVKFFLLMCLILLPLLWLGRTGTSESPGAIETSSRVVD